MSRQLGVSDMLACYLTLPSGESSAWRIVQTVSVPVLSRQCSVTDTAGNINSGGEHRTPSTQSNFIRRLRLV